ncbi:MAG: YhcH/YjgK/YiaL family protein [Blautia sp.]|nr:YhcH/YjgK/YiaL family protein [Blautia sp.]
MEEDVTDFICEGCEELSWAYLPDTKEVIPYNEEKKALFSKGFYAVHTVVLAGTFYVAFPNDAHRPSAHTGEENHHYRKIVLLLPVQKGRSSQYKRQHERKFRVCLTALHKVKKRPFLSME